MSSIDTNNTTLKHILNTRMLTILFLGFSSGLPLALSGGTLQAWLADVDVDIRSIMNNANRSRFSALSFVVVIGVLLSRSSHSGWKKS